MEPFAYSGAKFGQPLDYLWFDSGQVLQSYSSFKQANKDVGGNVSVHWKLCIEDGPKLCLRVKACYDPPIGGDICTGWKEVCVSID